jgi:hypothetical protein
MVLLTRESRSPPVFLNPHTFICVGIFFCVNFGEEVYINHAYVIFLIK